MKEWTEILENTQVQMTNKIRTIEGDMQGIEGFLNLRDSRKTMTFLASIDNDGHKEWEHVSVAYDNERRKTPSWAEMCAVKEVFWRPDEEVHQIHPKDSEYVHGYKGKDNILHLWRPVGGWQEG